MLAFDKLWKNHPTITGDDNPCKTDGKPNFTDQCAIRMGVCLARCGVDTSRIPGVTQLLGAVDIYLSEDDCERFFVLTRRGEEE